MFDLLSRNSWREKMIREIQIDQRFIARRRIACVGFLGMGVVVLLRALGADKYPALGVGLVVALVVSATGVAYAVLPRLGFYRCPRCRSRSRRLQDFRPAVHYYCSGCDVQWDLGTEYGGSESMDDFDE